MAKPDSNKPDHPHGGPPGRTGDHPQGGAPGQPRPEQHQGPQPTPGQSQPGTGHPNAADKPFHERMGGGNADPNTPANTKG